ncbi:DUF445 family protein [Colwellia sp. 4_MG-2023]|uniref:DUF445 family protein n=1 Tax=unclassified Colwellia TaxID=196834 RepID=UPI001C08D89C|nr:MULTISPECIES: DUF445 family protein [unclassified Colwellia]MBU2923649.1 DUF445 domain-containing protein [Colwellia sp. C2M11]MDO6505828.1 DUF445 family protein [Colwellia sp. 5_MG-2023]MDO6554509.1 DUF445 family protein [Colwellia sp. 4_MG-2023]MDO6652251.1 DUF445 family protein [Colwellia sp. 3_MG-2023]MDO6664580.1 DUF445 family protein [Colwellia sp. 2_MG-2023]
MNKSIITNFIALISTLLGLYLGNHILYTVGLFALSGAITNWLAIHMLFEKVPLLYGSGVIPARFEDFKLAIRQLMMEQFFTKENIDRFLSNGSGAATSIDLTNVIEKIDLTPAFNNLVAVIENSSFAPMLAMVGGSEALQPMKTPFIEKMKVSIQEISQSEQFTTLLREELEQPDMIENLQAKVSDIIEKRLNELTPQLVKEIIQAMIKKHLGWLVVWGGIFGGIIGLIAALTTNF